MLNGEMVSDVSNNEKNIYSNVGQDQTTLFVWKQINQVRKTGRQIKKWKGL